MTTSAQRRRQRLAAVRAGRDDRAHDVVVAGPADPCAHAHLASQSGPKAITDAILRVGAFTMRLFTRPRLAALLAPCPPRRSPPRRRARSRRPRRGTSSSRTSRSRPASACRSCGSTTGPSGRRTAARTAASPTPSSSFTGRAGPAAASCPTTSRACSSAPASSSTPTRYFVDPARRHRPRRIEQAQQRPARAVPALRLSRHGAGPAPPAHRGPEGRPPAARHGHVDGRDAHVALGRDVSRASWTRSCRWPRCPRRSRAGTG